MKKDKNTKSKLEELREKTKAEYKKLETNFNFPDKLKFENVLKTLNDDEEIGPNHPFIKLQTDLLKHMQSKTNDEEDILNSLKLLLSIWNLFPHKTLDNMSPSEKSGIVDLVDDKGYETNSKDVFKEKFKKLSKLVKAMSDVAEDITMEQLKKISGTKKDLEYIKNILKDPNAITAKSFEYVMQEIIPRKANQSMAPAKLTGLAREVLRVLGIFEQHAATKMPDNKYYNSRILQFIVTQALDLHNDKIETDQYQIEISSFIDPAFVYEKLAKTHQQIAEIHLQLEQADDKLFHSAHYVLLLIVQYDINYFLKFDAKTIAVLSIIFSYAVTKALSPKYKLGVKQEEIYKLIAKKHRKKVKKELSKLLEKILCNIPDPLIISADLENLPDEQEAFQKLAKIAPCMNFRSPISLEDLQNI